MAILLKKARLLRFTRNNNFLNWDLDGPSRLTDDLDFRTFNLIQSAKEYGGSQMIDYDYKIPTSLQEAIGLLKEYGNNAALIAGGTDVMVKIRNTRKAPGVLISLRRLNNLRYIQKKRRISHWRLDDPPNAGAVRSGKIGALSPA